MEEEINTYRGGGDDNSLVLSSPSSFSSALSSSDLDTESTSSFCQERSSTLGSLIGIAGDALLADGDHVPFHGLSNEAIPLHPLAGNTASSHGLSFSHTARIRSSTKLCSLLPCVPCKGLFYTNRGTCKVFRCADKANSHAGLPATALLSSSLGHLLVAEREAERSLERDARDPSDGARVYINIMYEENAQLEQVSINPLFDANSSLAMGMGGATHSDPGLQVCTRNRGLLRESRLPASMHADDEPRVLLVEGLSRGDSTHIPKCGMVASGSSPSLPIKGQKALTSRVCPLGCVSLGCNSYIWTRCKMQ